VSHALPVGRRTPRAFAPMTPRNPRLFTRPVPIALVAVACGGNHGFFKPGTRDAGLVEPDGAPGREAFTLDDTGLKGATVEPADPEPPGRAPGDVPDCAAADVA